MYESSLKLSQRVKSIKTGVIYMFFPYLESLDGKMVHCLVIVCL